MAPYHPNLKKTFIYHWFSVDFREQNKAKQVSSTHQLFPFKNINITIFTAVHLWNQCTFLQQEETKIQDKQGVRIRILKRGQKSIYLFLFYHFHTQPNPPTNALFLFSFLFLEGVRQLILKQIKWTWTRTRTRSSPCIKS